MRPLAESRVVQMWLKCRGRADLVTEEGGPVDVLYPGRANDSCGADFRDAVIRTEQGLLTGDIEIHSNSSHWRAHAHHLDPLYNRVILHVVFRHNCAGAASLENGRRAPTLALSRLFSPGGKSRPQTPSAPCRTGGKSLDHILHLLDSAGDERFQARAAAFLAAPSNEESAQALYRAMMIALGYTANRFAMAELACRLPLRRLEPGAPGESDTQYLIRCQALLLGKAGLLPSQRNEYDAASHGYNFLENAWRGTGEEPALSAGDWQFCRVRPDNYPDRRLMAMGYLLLRYRRAGLLNGLMALLTELPDETGCCLLEEALVVRRDGEGGALLGGGRAAIMIINALLPFAAAWGKISGQPRLAAKALELYRLYPALPANAIDRHMCRQLGFEAKQVGSARRQQGMLHIFKNWCSLGRCAACLLNAKAVSKAPPGCVSAGSR